MLKRLMNVGIILILPCMLWGQEQEIPFYKVFVKIEPDIHTINCQFEAKNPINPGFYLHGGLKIDSIWVDAKPVAHHEEQWSKRVVDAVIDSHLVVHYSGAIKDTAHQVNMIQPDLVELALYAAWFPLIDETKQFDFEMTLDLPEGFTTTTNGRLLNQETQKGRSISTWRSFQSGFDMSIVASPKLKTLVMQKGETEVQLYYDAIPENIIASKKDSLVKGMNLLTQFYGEPRVSGQLRFVYSPRDGWGYSRIPLFVTPQAYALSQLDQPLGQARDLHGAFHEMSHFWWAVADFNTTDDWINEGLAEYSAFRVSEACFGKAFADTLIQEYQDHAAKSQTQTSIVETKGDSQDRYVNRYEKTTLMFVAARKRFGEHALDGVLASIHRQYSENRDATTILFLKEVGRQLGKEASSWFESHLMQKDWSQKIK